MSRYGITEGPANVYGDDRKLCARVDIRKAKEADELELGAEAVITIKGRVKSLRGPEEYLAMEYQGSKKPDKEVKRTMPGSIELEVTEMKVGEVGQFDGMMKDY